MEELKLNLENKRNNESNMRKLILKYKNERDEISSEDYITILKYLFVDLNIDRLTIRYIFANSFIDLKIITRAVEENKFSNVSLSNINRHLISVEISIQICTKYNKNYN